MKEVEYADLPDARLRWRLGQLVEQFSEKMGQGIPTMCREWRDIKAAYRFLG